jgi:alkylation response protein AidB-like acyl-CoA dehydrogenase
MEFRTVFMNDNVGVDPSGLMGQPTPGSSTLTDLYEIVAAGAAARDDSRTHPYGVLDLLRQARFGALRLPRPEGGGASLRQVFQEAIFLGAADPNVAHIFRNHFTFVERFLLNTTDERRRPWREIVQRGGIVGLASTELDRKQIGGTAPLQTSLIDHGDGLRLNGTKYYSTGTLYADLIMVRATAADGGGVAVVIPTDRVGIERIDDWDGIGQRLTGTGTTNFHNVLVQPDEVIVDRDNPDYLLPFTSSIAQLFLTAINAGITLATLRDAKVLVAGRGRNFYYAPQPVAADDPLLQQTIGHLSANAFATQAAVLAAADYFDRVAEARSAGEGVRELAHDAAAAAAKAKVVVDELTLRSATALFDVGGASAATKGKNLDRHWRNARTLASHNPAVYKAQLVGAHELHGTRLPALGFF